MAHLAAYLGVRQTTPELQRTVMVLIVALAATVAGTVDRHGLYVVPRAVDVDRKFLKVPRSVHYVVAEAYPAAETISLIKRALTEAGWRPATCNEVGRYSWSSHTRGWRELPGVEPPVRLWSGTWVNARGDRVTYSLGYRAFAAGGLQPTYVQVAAWHQDLKAAERSRRASDAHMDRLRAEYPYLREPKPCVPEDAGEQ